MKKILFLMLALVMSVMGAWAQTTTSYPSTLKGNKYYTIASSARGGLTVNAAKTSLWGTSEGAASSRCTEEHANHFAFIQKDGSYYLYNILTYQYVDLTTSKGNLVESPVTSVKFKQEGNGTVMIYGDDDHIVNLGGSNQVTIDNWGGPNRSDAGRNKKDAGNSFTITEQESIPYKVFCNHSNGGVVYDGNTYANGETFTISGDNYISESVISAVDVSGFDKTLTIDGAKVIVQYTSGAAQDYTVESGTKSVSDILAEVTDLGNIIVKGGATLNIDQSFSASKIQAEDGATLQISYSNFNIAAITGAVNVILDVDYTLSGNKTTQATGKLTINSGKTLTFGGGDSETNSAASFTSVDVNGTLYYANKTSTWNNVTFNAGSILQSDDMGVPGSDKDNWNYENSFHMTGTTTVNGEVYILSNWNAQYTIDKLAGAGTLKFRGNAKNSEAAAEPTYYTISDVEDFSGALDVTNTQAYIKPISGIKISNALKVNTATLSNVTIVGSERINTAGNVTINGVKSNELTNSSYGYAFVGLGTINLAGYMDLTKAGTSGHSRVGYGAGNYVNIAEGATVITQGVFNTSTTSSNATLTIAAGATLTTTDKTSSPNFTNNGTINLPNLGATRYTAGTVNGESFNVKVSDELLADLTTPYTVVTGITTCNVTAFTLNGQAEYTLDEDKFCVKYENGAVVLVKKVPTFNYTVTYRTNGNHTWSVDGEGAVNSTLDINAFNVNFYDNFAFEGSNQLTEDNQKFVITCDEDFPFTAGQPCRMQTKRDVSYGGDFYVHTDGKAYAKAGVTSYEDNKNIWVIEHATGTPDIFTVRSYYNNNYLTLISSTETNQASMVENPQGTNEAPFTNEITSYFRVKRSTYSEPTDGFCLTHPKREQMCMAIHYTPSDWSTIGYGVGGWGNGDVDRNDNAVFVYPVETFTAKLAAESTEGNYGSIYLPYNMTLPERVEAYAATQEGEVLKLAKVGEAGNVIPAGAYILYSASESSAALALGAEATVSAEDNELTGKFQTGVALPTTGSNFVLNKKNDVVGFYKYSQTTYPVAKAVFSTGTESLVSAFRFDFATEQPTGIESLIEEMKQQGEVFDLQGRRLSKLQKGMNIINGRKVLR